MKPAGLQNFAWLITDESTNRSLAVTLKFTVASVTIEMVVGTVCAVLLAQFMLAVKGRLGRIYSRVLGSAYILPFAVPAIAGAFAWKMVLDAQFGPLNAMLDRHTPWLVDYALAAVVVIDAWKMTPFVIFVVLAAVLSIEPTQYEAAELDGAGAWRRFTHITLPSILPVVTITAAFRAVDAFTKVFDTVFATTGGGPGSDTRMLPLMIWRTAITNLDFGHAAAQAIEALLISLVFGVALLINQRRGRS
jgi:multiple sugar transport system permease protein